MVALVSTSRPAVSLIVREGMRPVDRLVKLFNAGDQRGVGIPNDLAEHLHDWMPAHGEEPRMIVRIYRDT